MRLWRRLTTCKTRSRFLLMAFWYALVALSIYVLYSLKDSRRSLDDSATTWRRSRFYNSLFGQIPVADDISMPQQSIIADDVGDQVAGWVETADEPGYNFAIDENEKFAQQLILRKSGAPSGNVELTRDTSDELVHEEERTLNEGEIETLDDFHKLEFKNRTRDNDSSAKVHAVTSTIDVTSIHFVNATAKPTPPPEVEGYYNIQSDAKLRLRCSQCALVSSSGHLVNTSAGAEIDSYPCVLRMNSAPVTGYEADLGSRTTIRIMGHVNLKVLNASNELQEEILRNPSSRAEKIIVPWLYNVNVNQKSDMYYKSARNLSTLYPDIDFFLLTPEKMKIAESLFQTEIGLSRKEARTWLSTGWMSMLFAIDVCDKVDIFGLVPEDYCVKNPNSSALYHYYEPDGLKECDYYKTSEERLTSGHKFITEKAVFARWATKFNMEFHIPAWNLTALARNSSIVSPFLKMFYEAKKSGTLPKTSNGTRIVRRVVKRVVKKVIIRRKIPVVQKKPAPQT